MNIWKDDSRLLRVCHCSCKKVFGCKRLMTKEWSRGAGKYMSWTKIEEVTTCDCCPYTEDTKNCEIKKTVKKKSADAYCPDCIAKKLSQRRD